MLNDGGTDALYAAFMRVCPTALWALAAGSVLAGCGYPVDPDKWMPDFGIEGDHGAIAVNATDMVGALTARYFTQGDADSKALQLCGNGCEIALRFHGDNTCGALASAPNKHFGVGSGSSEASAVAAAIDQCRAQGGDDCTEQLKGCND